MQPDRMLRVVENDAVFARTLSVRFSLNPTVLEERKPDAA
jgi:hypothetical protein